MKRILCNLLKVVAVITLIPGILVWIIGISAFLFRLFNWYKIGEWTKLIVIELIPNRFIVELTTNFPGVQKQLYWILNLEIIISLFGLGLILVVSFLILNGAAKRCEEKPTIVADRLKNLIGNK